MPCSIKVNLIVFKRIRISNKNKEMNLETINLLFDHSFLLYINSEWVIQFQKPKLSAQICATKSTKHSLIEMVNKSHPHPIARWSNLISHQRQARWQSLLFYRTAAFLTIRERPRRNLLQSTVNSANMPVSKTPHFLERSPSIKRRL